MKKSQVNQKISFKSLLKYTSLMGLTLLVFSCAKGGSSNPAPVQTVNPNCVNGICSGVVPQQTLFQSRSKDIGNQLVIDLTFMTATSNGTTYPQPQAQIYPNYPQGYYQQGYDQNNSVTGYSGSVYVTGQLQITQSIASGYGCVIPAGSYSLQMVQAGQWNQAIVTNLVMQAVGPTTLYVQIPQAQVSAKAPNGQTWNEMQPVGSLFGNLFLQTMNGYSCQISTLIHSI